MSQLHGIFHQKVDVCIFMAIILVFHHIVLQVFSLSLTHWNVTGVKLAGKSLSRALV